MVALQLSPSPADMERAAAPAALHLALKEMERAARHGSALPTEPQLAVNIARSLLGVDFAGPREIEVAIVRMKESAAASSTTATDDALSRLAAGRPSRNVEALVGLPTVPRAISLVSGFLGEAHRLP